MTVEYILEMENPGASLIELEFLLVIQLLKDHSEFRAPIYEHYRRDDSQGFEIMLRGSLNDMNIHFVLINTLRQFLHYGYDEFFKKCQETGVDGIIIPDCPYEESKEVSDICYKYDVDLISMIAPTSKERTLEIAAQAKGFIYLVSSMGVTGMRSNIVTDIEGIVESIKTVTDTPVALGFGINSPAQVKHFGNIADGVIVGSAIVNLIKEHGDRAHQPLFNYIQTLIKEL